MKKRYAYILEHFLDKQPTIVAVCSSFQKAKDIIKKLPKSYPYTLYKIPKNDVITKGIKLKDQQGIYEMHHFGTHLSEIVESDDKGNILKEGKEKVVFWPFQK
jgi:hypothetical protein